MSHDRLSPSHRAFLSSLFSMSIPKNCVKVVENTRWKEAMIEETRDLLKNDIWELNALLAIKRVIGCE